MLTNPRKRLSGKWVQDRNNMFVKTTLQFDECWALITAALVVYILSLRAVIVLLSQQHHGTRYPSPALFLGWAALTGLPPFPLFFFKFWIVGLAGSLGTVPFITVLVILNLATTCLYLFTFKRLVSMASQTWGVPARVSLQCPLTLTVPQLWTLTVLTTTLPTLVI